MMRHILCAAIACLASVALAQEVQPVQVGETTGFGITYSLPKTAVQVTVTAKCTRIKAGQFAAYAEKQVGIADAPQEDQTNWEIVDVKLGSVGVADTSRTFHINFSGSVMPVFYLTADGLLAAVNRAPRPAASDEVAPDEGAQPQRRPLGVMTEELLRAGSKARQAEVAARQIFRIRESRMDLLTGEAENAPKDGAAYQLVMDNLDAQEQAYLSMFAGERTETLVTRTYLWGPEGETREAVPFRFSRRLGLVDSDDLSGAPYRLTLLLTEDNREVPTADGKKKSTPSGIAYLLPGKARVSLRQGRNVVAEEDLQLGQYGRVERLQPNYFTDKKRSASAEFSTATGSIRIFEQ